MINTTLQFDYNLITIQIDLFPFIVICHNNFLKVEKKNCVGAN